MTTPKKKPAKKKAISGGAHLIASGKKPILFGASAEEHERIRQAAEITKRSMAQFALYATVKEAEKTILQNNS